MSCTETHELLHDLLDGSLSAGAADAVRRHLDGCAACRGELAAIDALRRAAASLPRSVEPDRDLWPSIADRLTSDGIVRAAFDGATRSAAPTASRGVALRWIAVAAVVVLAVLAAYQLGRSQRSPLMAENGVATGPPAAVAASASPDVEVELQQVRDDLRARLELRRDALDPATLDVIDDNLELIDGAIERISAALASDPGNARLTRQLVFAYRQQIDLLRRSTEMPLEL